MGFFAFGGIKKDNLTGKAGLLVEASTEEIQKALAANGMFFCSHYLCTMQERHCIAYQKKAIQGFHPGTGNLYRPECESCAQGRDIAKKHQVALPKKKTEKKCLGCGKMLPLSEFYSVDSRSKRFARCITCQAEYNREYAERCAEEVM